MKCTFDRVEQIYVITYQKFSDTIITSNSCELLILPLHLLFYIKIHLMVFPIISKLENTYLTIGPLFQTFIY